MNTLKQRHAGFYLLSAALLMLPIAATAQGGQGAFGGRTGQAAEVREGDAVSYQHIMTPGDRGEWPISARAGETMIVFVSSTTFDPAAQIVDVRRDSLESGSGRADQPDRSGVDAVSETQADAVDDRCPAIWTHHQEALVAGSLFQ